jgi:lipoprotein-anchoring transpeptidase ErfK/SrfK
VKHLFLVAIACLLLTSAASAELRLEIDLSDRELRAVIDGQVAETFAVSIGNERKPTPTGEFKIRKLIWNPAWKPPNEKWARGKTAKPAGHPDNPMKVVKMFFKEPDYYIHGTDDDDSLGGAASHGCIRMSEDDVTQLGQLVMDHGGKPMPAPWYRRLFQRRTTKVVYLAAPVPVEIRR